MYAKEFIMTKVSGFVVFAIVSVVLLTSAAFADPVIFQTKMSSFAVFVQMWF